MAAAGTVVMGWSHRFYASLWLVFLMGAVARKNERYTLVFEDNDKFRLLTHRKLPSPEARESCISNRSKQT